MAVTCRKLMELDIFKSLKLVAGESGLDAMVSWPYIKQMDTLTGWIYGGELVFVMGHGDECTTENLEKTVKECNSYHAGGLVVLCGEEGMIEKIPEKIISLSDTYNLPLFEMPFNLRLIDITKEISNAIVLSDLRGKHDENFMSNLFFDKFITEEQLITEGEMCGVNLKGNILVAVLGIKETFVSQDKSERIEYRNIIGSLNHRISSEFDGNVEAVMTYMTPIHGIILLEIHDAADKTIVSGMLGNVIKRYSKDIKREICGGISDVHKGLSGIRMAYSEGKHALQYAMISKNSDDMLCNYGDMGLMRYMLCSEDKEHVLGYCRHITAPIRDMDLEGRNDYMRTVHEYIMNNGNLVKTANALYIHRNTLINRLSRVSAALGKDINNVELKNELYNVFVVLKYYGIEF